MKKRLLDALEGHPELTGTERQLHMTLTALLRRGEKSVVINTSGLESVTARRSPVIFRSIAALEEAGLWKRESRGGEGGLNRYHALFLDANPK